MNAAGASLRRRARLRWSALLATVICGCGEVPRAVVRGTVTLDGRPLAAGRVVFESAGRSYVGEIGADGRYELVFEGASGVPPDTYGVAVLPPETELVADPKTTDLREVNPVDQKLYPERYRSATTSGITQVVAAGESTVDIELTSR